MKKPVSILFALHLLLMVYSTSGILSKKCAGVPFLSVSFIRYYCGIIFLLGLYAVGWQQIIKRMPLTTAYANKSVTVIWGFVWGVLFFTEKVTLGKIVGLLMVVFGIILYTLADGHNDPSGV